ncbi:DEAD/DEAH box helicase [Actinomycetospora termitidis]|uniref:DEAD/DEAH box helicase n=1 Tax=Actinomycetospora termitidis TaxID=3053470 RepID=A0ABT7M648_9PSEU|nr:DEAD/DEAH box helicase [Actinomycetospora sp. Odt1-22]MDL5155547.1 DEAD/DEAH box helicase [Actinomycetospora sp. Odt1-22]
MQLSFLVEREVFAWWGGDDPLGAARAVGLDADADSVALVRPEDGVMTVGPVSVAVSPAEPTIAALAAAVPPDGWGRSVRAWRDVAVALDAGPVLADDDRARLAAGLPVAAHAGVGADGATVWTARVAVDTAARLVDAASDAPSVWPRLRPYQRAGAQWLHSRLDEAGGALLADEMGLGKTVQAIAVLASRSGPHLVVCPASVAGTWHREILRFAPELGVVEHGSRAGRPRPGAVVVATYGQLRAAAVLADTSWDVVVLDEAQQIKNPDTATSRRARSLVARGRIALSGTPVENRLDDLWALLAFTTPEVLGTRSSFRRRFAGARAGGGAAAGRVAALVGPHLLRRRKAEVATELPARLDLAHGLDPTDEQRRLHRAALDDALGHGLGAGRDRRGRVLALLTRLKQICVQPALVAETVDGGLDGRSASWDRLTELLGEIVDNGDAALVFTQYRRAGELLAAHLAGRVTDAPAPFLHGGLSRARRERLVEEFSHDDGPPVLVLSLRAAGTGLTLTRATHVLHLDRWWNPAVEAQASDRAHRIGQTRTVTVHTFATRGTVEVLIADLHRDKRGIASAALGEAGGDAVGALTRLGDEELRAVLEAAPC